jgi:hypothetical protein
MAIGIGFGSGIASNGTRSARLVFHHDGLT